MALKNKALQKLWDGLSAFNSCDPMAVVDLFKECDEAIEGEIAAIKAELTDANRRKDIYHSSADSLRNMALERGDELRKANNQIESLKKMIDELKEKLNNERKHGEDLADINGQLASENADLKERTSRLIFLENSRTAWRSRAQHAEKAVTDLNKKVNDLEKENANLRVTPPDANAIEALEKENSKLNTKCKSYWKALFEAKADVNTLKKKIQDLEEENASLDEDVNALVAENTDLHERLSSVEKSNSILRGDNETLFARLEAADIFKRPWHGDANARTSECSKELKAEKARLEEKVDLSYGHDFKFGDEVFVPWSCEPYMYVIRGRLYNPRTENLVYVSGTEHLKWFGDKFSIV